MTGLGSGAALRAALDGSRARRPIAVLQRDIGAPQERANGDVA